MKPMNFTFKISYKWTSLKSLRRSLLRQPSLSVEIMLSLSQWV